MEMNRRGREKRRKGEGERDEEGTMWTEEGPREGKGTVPLPSRLQ
jgi:hypothetical protein